MTKKSSSGGYDWSFKYPTIDLLQNSASSILSSYRNTLRIMGGMQGADSQYVKISTCKYDNIKHTIQVSFK